MKRVLVIVLCLCILVSGCKKGGNNISETGRETSPENTDKETLGENTRDDDEVGTGKEAQGGKEENNTGEDMTDGEQPGPIRPVGAITSFGLNKEWSGQDTVKNELPYLVIPEYEAKVDAYRINKDLSNIENINQFSGFTEDQIKSLVENGFVVIPSNDTRVYYTYDFNEYKGIPNFVTADSILCLYHQFYDKSLAGIEMGYLYDDLELLSRQMLVHSIQLLKTLKDDKLIELQERNIIFFLVACMLMADSTDMGKIAGNELIEDGGLDIPENLYDTAVHEYNMINEAGGFEYSDYLNLRFDYSQFTVRGHYTRSEELGRFFRTMMWYGTAPIPLGDSKGCIPDNVLQALLITHTTFLDSDGICSAKLWSRIYKPTSTYVGVSDDIDVFTMNNLRKTVFGDNEDPNVYNKSEYKDRLFEEVKKLPEPRDQQKYAGMPAEKQFRFMGQRFVMDSYILQELIDPIERPIPSALDVMGVLGSSTAEDLLFNHYKPQEQWPEYESKYNKLYAEVSEYGIDTWANNLYSGWVWVIKEALAEFGDSSGMPMFMTNDAWKYKSLNTALGSYTELKHDSVLYGKQAGAEGGSDIYTAKYHYVEPNVPLYCKLLFLTGNTVDTLNELGMMSPEMNEGAELYKELLQILISCSIKELRNELLSEEEYRALLYVGSKIEYISQLFLAGVSGESFAYWDMADMLVTDIATYGNSYLSLGTGYFDDIYVVFPVDGKLYLGTGPVYSHYEFVSSTRLTDEDWWAMQGVIIERGEYYEYPVFADPSENLPEQPFWTRYFKSDINNVEIKSLEEVTINMVQ